MTFDNAWSFLKAKQYVEHRESGFSGSLGSYANKHMRAQLGGAAKGLPKEKLEEIRIRLMEEMMNNLGGYGLNQLHGVSAKDFPKGKKKVTAPQSTPEKPYQSTSAPAAESSPQHTMEEVQAAIQLLHHFNMEVTPENVQTIFDARGGLSQDPILPETPNELERTFRGTPVDAEEMQRRVLRHESPKTQDDTQESTVLSPKEIYEREKEDRYLSIPSIEDPMNNPITPRSHFQEQKEASQNEMSTEDRLQEMMNAREAHGTAKTLAERRVGEATTLDDFMDLIDNPAAGAQLDEFKPNEAQQTLNTLLDEDGNLRPEYR
jgi:hypothetical protein